ISEVLMNTMVAGQCFQQGCQPIHILYLHAQTHTHTRRHTHTHTHTLTHHCLSHFYLLRLSFSFPRPSSVRHGGEREQRYGRDYWRAFKREQGEAGFEFEMLYLFISISVPLYLHLCSSLCMCSISLSLSLSLSLCFPDRKSTRLHYS